MNMLIQNYYITFEKCWLILEIHYWLLFLFRHCYKLIYYLIHFFYKLVNNFYKTYQIYNFLLLFLFYGILYLHHQLMLNCYFSYVFSSIFNITLNMSSNALISMEFPACLYKHSLGRIFSLINLLNLLKSLSSNPISL